MSIVTSFFRWLASLVRRRRVIGHFGGPPAPPPPTGGHLQFNQASNGGQIIILEDI